jgi:hypothetical protein
MLRKSGLLSHGKELRENKTKTKTEQTKKQKTKEMIK